MYIIRRCRNPEDVIAYLNAMERAEAEVVSVIYSDARFNSSDILGEKFFIFARVRDEDHMVKIDAYYCGYIP